MLTSAEPLRTVVAIANLTMTTLLIELNKLNELILKSTVPTIFFLIISKGFRTKILLNKTKYLWKERKKKKKKKKGVAPKN